MTLPRVNEWTSTLHHLVTGGGGGGSATHVNFLEFFLEEEDWLSELQPGRGIRARDQPLVPCCLPEAEQFFQLQGTGRGNRGEEQQEQQHAGGAGEAAETQEPEPSHLVF